MEYIIKGYRRGSLGEPSAEIPQVDESTLKKNVLSTFNNCDYIGTITIKGAHKQRLLCNNTNAQFFLFEKIKDLIQSYCKYYVINYELHKCNEWIHSHFIFRPTYRSKVPLLRKEIYQLITGHPLKRKSYRHRILLEKPYKISNYVEYMFKQFHEMKFFNIYSHYKLLSNIEYICPKESPTQRKEKVKNPIPTQNTDIMSPVLTDI